MRLRRTTLSASLLALALTATVACGSGGSGAAITAAPAADSSDPLAPRMLSERVTVTMAQVGSIISNLPVYVADAKGEFDKENIELKLETVAIPDNLLVVERGDADFTNGTVSAGILNVQSSGKNVRLAFPGGTTRPESKFGLWVNKSVAGADGIVQPDELRGKTISSPSGPNTSLYYYFDPINKANPGQKPLMPTDVKLATLAAADVSTALMNGSIEAGSAIDPFWIQLQQSNCCVWVSGKPEYPVSGYLFGPTLLDRQPEVGLAVTRALTRAVRDHLQGDWTEKPDIVEIAAKYTKQPAESLAALPADNYGTGRPAEMAARLDQRYLDGAQSEFFTRVVAGAPALKYPTPLTYEQVFYDGYLKQLAGGAT